MQENTPKNSEKGSEIKVAGISKRIDLLEPLATIIQRLYDMDENLALLELAFDSDKKKRVYESLNASKKLLDKLINELAAIKKNDYTSG